MSMTETIEAIFEALPMAILQFLNNQMKGTPWTIFDMYFYRNQV